MLESLARVLRPDGTDELLAELVAATGDSLRPDTPGGTRRRQRRHQTANRERQSLVLRMRLAEAQAMQLRGRARRAIDPGLLAAAQRPGAASSTLERAAVMVREIQALLTAADEAQAEASRLRALLNPAA